MVKGIVCSAIAFALFYRLQTSNVLWQFQFHPLDTPAAVAPHSVYSALTTYKGCSCC
jgi:hypothetical protein